MDTNQDIFEKHQGTSEKTYRTFGKTQGISKKKLKEFGSKLKVSEVSASLILPESAQKKACISYNFFFLKSGFFVFSDGGGVIFGLWRPQNVKNLIPWTQKSFLWT